ncbi:MAG: hypothetical protein KF708_12305 [Pirellulales bacterium]|nr:hypothetical protein [Pirellulales bacterium]
MSIDISPEHRDFVREELASGHYATEQELIDEAIELLRSRQGVLSKLKAGVEQLERGEGIEYGPNDRSRFITDILGQVSTAKEPQQ